jgi:hypothetical protein
MFLLCLNTSDKRLLYIIAGSSALFELVHVADVDIALYYATCSMISMVTAYTSVCVIKSTPSKVFAIFLSIQAMLCFCLVPDWPFLVNEWLQFKLSEFNDILIFILIALGVSTSDSAIKQWCDNT